MSQPEEEVKGISSSKRDYAIVESLDPNSTIDRTEVEQIFKQVIQLVKNSNIETLLREKMDITDQDLKSPIEILEKELDEVVNSISEKKDINMRELISRTLDSLDSPAWIPKD